MNIHSERALTSGFHYEMSASTVEQTPYLAQSMALDSDSHGRRWP